MTKPITFDKATHKEIQAAMLAAMSDVAKKYGVEIKAMGGKYGEGKFDMRFGVALPAGHPGAVEEEKKVFATYCNLFGLSPEHFNKEITFQGSTYRIAGILPNRPKFPIKVCQVGTNKIMIITADGARRALGLPPQTW